MCLDRDPAYPSCTKNPEANNDAEQRCKTNGCLHRPNHSLLVQLCIPLRPHTAEAPPKILQNVAANSKLGVGPAVLEQAGGSRPELLARRREAGPTCFSVLSALGDRKTAFIFLFPCSPALGGCFRRWNNSQCRRWNNSQNKIITPCNWSTLHSGVDP